MSVETAVECHHLVCADRNARLIVNIAEVSPEIDGRRCRRIGETGTAVNPRLEANVIAASTAQPNHRQGQSKSRYDVLHGISLRQMAGRRTVKTNNSRPTLAKKAPPDLRPAVS